MERNRITHQALEAVVMATGLWDAGRRHGNHSFPLARDVFCISRAQRDELDTLAKSVQRCLLGVSRLVAIASDSNLHGSRGAYAALYQALVRGTPYGLHAVRPGNVPLLSKVDLMVGLDGQFKIAEIDATNPRSWGYSIIGRRLCELVAPGSERLPGVIPYLARHFRKQKTKEVCFLYGHTQRFYAPEFAIAAAELRDYGIEMTVLDETDVLVKPDGLVDARTGAALPNWFIDFPMMNQNKPLIDWLRLAATERRVEFVIPPKHFLSSKAMLAILSNAGQEPNIEHLLLSQIAGSDLALVRRYLPPTYLVGNDQMQLAQAVAASGPHLLKACVSSGMKGITFSDDPSFGRTLQAALGQRGEYVLQEEVPGRPYRFTAYHGDGSVESGDWYVRLTGYFSRDGAQDLAVSACRDKRVHGGVRSIVTGTIII